MSNIEEELGTALSLKKAAPVSGRRKSPAAGPQQVLSSSSSSAGILSNFNGWISNPDAIRASSAFYFAKEAKGGQPVTLESAYKTAKLLFARSNLSNSFFVDIIDSRKGEVLSLDEFSTAVVGFALTAFGALQLDKVDKSSKEERLNKPPNSDGVVMQEGKEEEEPIVLTGPVVGKVTHNTAVIMLEIDEAAELECVLTPKQSGGTPVSCKVKFPSRHPRCFVLKGLNPDTVYTYHVKGISLAQEQENISSHAKFFQLKTFPAPGNVKTLKVVALSCDRPRRLFKNQENPWEALRDDAKNIDLMLHLGDQVYTKMDGFLERAVMQSDLYALKGASNKVKTKALHMASEELRGAYRYNWNLPATAHTLSQSSHLMLWSDNDVANDFTEARSKEGGQLYAPVLLRAGLEIYSEYQRQLWDPAGKGIVKKESKKMKEFAFHNYGPLGVFMVDMRGTHITPEGVVDEHPCVIDYDQRAAIEEAFKTKGLSCMLICSEIPFASDTAASLRKEGRPFFLRSHWGYNEELSNWLFSLSFDWKAAAPGREVAFLGGDIHTGLISTIKDEKTGLTIPSITTSPVTNHVCKYFSPLEVQYNERFSFKELAALSQERLLKASAVFSFVGAFTFVYFVPTFSHRTRLAAPK